MEYTTGMWLARCAVSAIAFGAAAFLAYHGKEGWGWLIFAGIMAIPTVTWVDQ